MEIPFHSLKEGLYILERMVQEREKMRDCRWYQIWEKDCIKFADKLVKAGADEDDIAAVMSWTETN